MILWAKNESTILSLSLSLFCPFSSSFLSPSPPTNCVEAFGTSLSWRGHGAPPHMWLLRWIRVGIWLGETDAAVYPTWSVVVSCIHFPTDLINAVGFTMRVSLVFVSMGIGEERRGGSIICMWMLLLTVASHVPSSIRFCFTSDLKNGMFYLFIF